jgi:hypothetical protein
VQDSASYWAGFRDVDTIQLEEGESLADSKSERLTADRLDALALYWACPDVVRATWTGPKSYRELALRVGCRVASLPKWKKHPKMGERIAEYITTAARLAMPNILYAQMQVAATGDTKAGNFVATIGKFIRSGGTVSVNQTNIAAEPEERMTDEDMDKRIARFMAKVEEHGGDVA